MDRSETESFVSLDRIIGLAEELGFLERWLAEPKPRTELFFVSGIGGIGKTTLLTEMSRRARDSQAQVLWLDGPGELGTSAAFLSGMEACLENEYGRKREQDAPTFAFITSELSSRRSVIFLDNCENIERIEGWFFSSFLPKLEAAGVLFVLASRNGLPAKWRTNPYWGSRVRDLPLRVFTRKEVREYLRESGLDPALQAEVARHSDGHPLLLALTVDLLKSSPESTAGRGLSDIPAMLSAELLKEVTSPRLYAALIGLSLLPEADLLVLRQFLDTPLELSDYEELGRLSFVGRNPRGLALHHVASRLIREDYAERSPQPFRLERQRAFRLLAERFPYADRRAQTRIAAHVLKLYREFLPSAHAYAHFSTRLQAAEDRPYQPEDLPDLQRMVADSVRGADWQTELVKAEDYAGLLVRIAGMSPEGICVVRSDMGTPLAFCAGVSLHPSTLSLLEKYAPRLLQMLGEELEPLYSASQEGADTFCILLAAVDVRQPHYRPEELGGLLMQQWLIRMTGGFRGIVVTGDPNLNTLLPMMGFQKTGQFALSENGTLLLTRWDLDFRFTSFEHWVKRVIRQTETEGELSEFPQVAAALEPERYRADAIHIDDHEMKQILKELYRPDKLEELAVIRRLGRPGSEIRRHVEQILTGQDTAYPLTALEQRILREIYILKELNKSQLAEDFHMSRTTFYRHAQSATGHLAMVLSKALER
ncbi:bacterio-opsin activator [Paenibacillus faecis]|uniref:Bacterio-opsin activator n=1 Tax=Paenibacillus faecis TaxID=862114 RepID=A0A5D0CWB2_9BACL|nr:bacterio-opsin activator [Paenibacillus faecis]TYA13464.1 bacterio-opsin activator [Paenibacillus faecis]